MKVTKSAISGSHSTQNRISTTAAQTSGTDLPALREAIHRIQGLEGEVSSVIQEMEEKVRQLELLNNFSSLLNSTLDPELVREKALEATCELLRCETASLLLINFARNDLYWDVALGDAGAELKRTVRLPLNDQSIAGAVALTGQSVLLNDVESDARFRKNAKFKTRTMICVPLKAKEKIIGVLQALNKVGEFAPHDVKLLETLSHQVAIAFENANLYAEIKKNFYETVEALAESIEKKDRYTGGHTKRVVHYSLCIAKYMKDMTPALLEQVRLGAVLHDIGKIGIEDKILKKDAPLNDEEWIVMQKHPDIGSDILKRVTGLQGALQAMRFHHERWDGKGYPTGLKGEEIPLIARVIAIADTFDAMVSTRPYRKGLDPKIAFDEIVKHSGTQFDPTLVEAFVLAFAREKMGRGSGGSSFYGQ